MVDLMCVLKIKIDEEERMRERNRISAKKNTEEFEKLRKNTVVMSPIVN